MKTISLIFTLLFIFLLFNCFPTEQEGNDPEKKSLRNTLCIGDTLNSAGIIRLSGHNNCSEGFNNYKIYADNINVPLCPVEGRNKLITKCLPNIFKKDGVRIKFLAVVLPVPPDAKLDCGLIEVLEIDILN